MQRAFPAVFPPVNILLYHRITDLEVDPWNLCVSPNAFAEQLEVIRASGLCLTLKELIRGWNTKRSLGPCFVVTFDDGYADNLELAKPLLERFEVPATMFLVSGMVGKKQEFWWDVLERVFLQGARLPQELKLKVGQEVRAWDLESESESASLQKDWRADEQVPPGRRQAVFLEVWNVLCRLASNDERQDLTNDILAWAGLDLTPRQEYSVLGIDEALALGAGGLIEIGAHTKTHASLIDLPATLQEEEVDGSKADLERLFGHEINSFSYPYGRQNPAVANLVRARGFASACTCVERPAWLGDNCFLLPRIQVKNWDGDTFSRELSKK